MQSLHARRESAEEREKPRKLSSIYLFSIKNVKNISNINFFNITWTLDILPSTLDKNLQS